MDIITTQDRSVSTESPKRKHKEEKDLEVLKKSVLHNGQSKTEKKKSDNKKLKKKLIEIEEQNVSLTKRINDKNNELEELRKSINSLNAVLNSVPIEELRSNSSIASTKLLELSKKNRQLKAELETTKNRLNKRDMHVKKLEKDLKIAVEKVNQDADLIKRNLSPIDEMQTKISALQQKLFETRNKNIELNNQLKLAQKCLQQEIGEHFNLNLLASHANSSNWRGRAQQILHLQQKIQELKECLESQGHQNSNHDFDMKGVVGYDPPLLTSGSLSSIERPSVRKSEIQHRVKVEALEKEICMMKSQLEEHNAKILALKVRNKTLNDEISRYKMKANSLEEQTDFNNINVASMNDKLMQQKCNYEKEINELSHEIKNLLKQREDMTMEKEHMQEKIEDLERTVAKKDEIIEKLNGVVRKLEDDLKALCGGFLFSCREFNKEEFITILDSLESEKNVLMDHNETLNQRIIEERNKNENLQEQLSKHKLRISRLETKVRDLDRELEALNEKKKRSQRIAEYTNNLTTLGTTNSICSFTFENTSLMSSNNLEDFNDCNIIDLKNRLELATEKINILNEKLDHISAEKENDIKTFQQILANSKNIIFETIVAQRNSSEIIN